MMAASCLVFSFLTIRTLFEVCFWPVFTGFTGLGTLPRSLTVSMSRNRLFLGKVSLQQSPPPLHRMMASVKEVRRQNVKDVSAFDSMNTEDTPITEVRYWFDPALAAAGISNYTWHDNRHSACSLWVIEACR